MDEIRTFPTPPQLLEIPDSPSHLYIRGKEPDHNEVMLAVVGSRKYTSYGKSACEELIRGLRGFPITIVSGLAIGIDGIAHKSAIEHGLRTIAVPGSGLSDQVLYPRSHVGLAQSILANGGALISEFAPDFRATEWSFPKRNRIMAGLSKAVLVIEAGERSGTLITSRLATEYNRDVLAVPGSIFSENSKGPNMLITLGASPIRNSNDILYALGIDPEQAAQKDLSSLPLLQQQILKELTEPMTKDMLTIKMNIDISELNVALMKMEIMGLTKEESGMIRKIN